MLHNIFRHIANAFRTPAPSLRGVVRGEAVLGLGVFFLTLTSCVDTIILPDDKTVEEDFWKTKTQVQSMVNGAYSSLASEEVKRKLVI